MRTSAPQMRWVLSGLWRLLSREGSQMCTTATTAESQPSAWVVGSSWEMSWLQRRAWAGGRRWPSLRPFIALCGHDILLRVISLLSFHPWFPLLANSKPEPQNKGDSGKHRSRHPRWGFGFYSHGKESPLTFTTPEPTLKNIGSSLPFTSASSLPYSFYISLLLTQFLSPKSFKFPFFW